MFPSTRFQAATTLFYPWCFPEANVKPLMVGAVGRPWIKHSSQCPRWDETETTGLEVVSLPGEWANISQPNGKFGKSSSSTKVPLECSIEFWRLFNISGVRCIWIRDVSKADIAWWCPQEKIHCVNMDSKLVMFVVFSILMISKAWVYEDLLKGWPIWLCSGWCSTSSPAGNGSPWMSFQVTWEEHREKKSDKVRSV